MGVKTEEGVAPVAQFQGALFAKWDGPALLCTLPSALFLLRPPKTSELSAHRAQGTGRRVVQVK